MDQRDRDGASEVVAANLGDVIQLQPAINHVMVTALPAGSRAAVTDTFAREPAE